MQNYFYTNACLYRDTMYLRGFANGKRFQDEIPLKPYIFLEGNGSYKTLDGKSCYKKEFNSIKESRDYLKRYEEIENFKYYGMTNWLYPFLHDEFKGEINYNTDLIQIAYIDIEVASRRYNNATGKYETHFPDPKIANQEVTAITIIRNDKIITFGTKYYKPKDLNITYVLCKNENDLLSKFLIFWSSDYPDVISGWNSDLFDTTYLINRIRNVLGEKAIRLISPWKIVNEREIIRAKTTSHFSNKIEKRTEQIYDIAGISQLDYLQLYKKFTNVNHESYRLDNIAFHELGEHKLDYSNFDNLDDLYDKDPERFFEYNIHDAVLVKKLEEKLGYLLQIMALAYKTKINYMDAFTTTKPWDVVIHNFLMSKNIVIPQYKKKPDRELIGAYVHEPQIGLHKYVVSFDFKSLYPSIISELNISPETYVQSDYDMPSIDNIISNRSINSITDDLAKKNLSLCANKCVYQKNIRGFIPEIVDLYINDRDNVKKKMIQLQKQNLIIEEEIKKRGISL